MGTVDRFKLLLNNARFRRSLFCLHAKSMQYQCIASGPASFAKNQWRPVDVGHVDRSRRHLVPVPTVYARRPSFVLSSYPFVILQW